MSEHIIETEVFAGTPFVPVGGTGKLREEIVRCRDCKHYHDSINGCDEFGDEWSDEYANVEPDGFCAWACRKEQQ